MSTDGPCPHCGCDVRLGVRLSPLKARIFDMVRRAGPDGIEGELLFDAVLGRRPVRRKTLAVHISQINQAIRDSGFTISSRGCCYALRARSRAKELAA